MPHTLTFKLLAGGGLSVVKLAPDAAVPAWALSPAAAGPLTSITRTPDELSLVLATAAVPAGPAEALAASGGVLAHEPGWAALAIDMGALPFGMTGVLLAALQPLAGAGVGIFAMSTYNTDVVMVKAAELAPAVAALRAAGHTVNGA